MDSQNNMSYNAGQAQGQAQEKAGSMMDKASNTAQSAEDSVQDTSSSSNQSSFSRLTNFTCGGLAGQQVKDKTQGATDAVKNATGMNKSS